ncbi:nucleotidyltransferase domain-containing protein [Endozoicomonas numazuensis]|uniref:hypothetical protein n=1 Tax=Endozoicomonas numazuensis TaxID=1137799 RepID=UPI000AC4A7A8|nr:hypothetical protein [Endozoicomonas numazuensis]
MSEFSTESLIQLIQKLEEVDAIYLYGSRASKKLYGRGIPIVRRIESAIISAWEKDYER